MTKKLKVVAIEALSYSGTTWLNLVLGSHPEAFTLGPPHRIWALKDKGFQGANLVHGKDDTFWTGFDRAWDRQENFLLALGRYRGASHIVFDNPAPEFQSEVMSHPDIEVKWFRYLRDARAIAASYARKNPDKPFIDTIVPSGWLYHSFMNMRPEGHGKAQVFRYEESCADPARFLQDAGRFIGLSYDERSLRYWDFDHHITSGNQGTIALVRHAKGIPVGNFAGSSFYVEQFAKMQQDPLGQMRDERWKSQLGRLELFQFDVIMGAHNESLGYARDTFGDDELIRLLEKHEDAVARTGCVDFPPDFLDRYLAARTRKATARDGTMSVGGTLRRKGLGLLAKGRSVASKLNQVLSRRLPMVAQSSPGPAAPPEAPLPDPACPEASGTFYFDEISDAHRAQINPYVAVNSRMSIAEVFRAAHINNYHAFGPDYANKNPYRIAVDPPQRYRDLLTGVLALPKTRFVTAAEMVGVTPSPDELVCHVRHDCDGDIYSSLQQARIEASLGVRTTFYILHTAPYYGEWRDGKFHRHERMIEVYLEMQKLGHEVAIHSDGLGVYQLFGADGSEGLLKEFEWLRSHGIRICGTVTHNSFGVYGAENSAVFSQRTVGFARPEQPKVVVHNGRVALLGQLDEGACGMTYEGNELFLQRRVGVQYYALRGANDWRYQAYNPARIPQGPGTSPTTPSWFTQEQLIDHLAASPRGVHVVFAIHPEYYGMRAEEGSPPPDGIEHGIAIGIEEQTRALEPSMAWMLGTMAADRRGTPKISQRYGTAGGLPERQSVACLNEQGFFDVPASYVAGLARRVLFVGKDHLASDIVAVECKVPQALVRVGRRCHRKSWGATSVAAAVAPLAVRLAWAGTMASMMRPTDIVLSVGLSDLVIETPALVSKVWDVPASRTSALLPATFRSKDLAGALLVPLQRRHAAIPPADLSALFDLHGADRETAEVAQLRARIHAALASIGQGVRLFVMVEDLGEPIGWDWHAASREERVRLCDLADRIFASVAESAGARYVNPYRSFLDYGGRASTHWRSANAWSIHGHSLAGDAVATALLAEDADATPKS